MRITAITGGIGSGKSVVSAILRAMSYPVYDCDMRAKILMDADPAIKRAIARDIHTSVITTDGSIDRRLLAEIVFADPIKLGALNAIVHGAVREDIARWSHGIALPHVWIETAILYESGLDRMVSDVWEVYAPEPLRIERVMARNGMSEKQVKARIEAQNRTSGHTHPAVETIVNDGISPLLPRVLSLL